MPASPSSAPGGLRPRRTGRARGSGRSTRGCASSLPPQVGSGRRVAAVDVLVAVLAGVLHRAVAHREAGERVGAVVQGSGMAGAQVAALAEVRLPCGEKLLVV